MVVVRIPLPGGGAPVRPGATGAPAGPEGRGSSVGGCPARRGPASQFGRKRAPAPKIGGAPSVRPSTPPAHPGRARLPPIGQKGRRRTGGVDNRKIGRGKRSVKEKIKIICIFSLTAILRARPSFETRLRDAALRAAPQPLLRMKLYGLRLTLLFILRRPLRRREAPSRNGRLEGRQHPTPNVLPPPLRSSGRSPPRRGCG